MATFKLGALVRLSAAFTDVDGLAADPTDVTIKHRVGNTGTITTEVYNGGAGNVIKDSVGNYHLDVLLDTIGTWYWRAIGDDALGETLVAADETKYTVEESRFD